MNVNLSSLVRAKAGGLGLNLSPTFESVMDKYLELEGVRHLQEQEKLTVATHLTNAAIQIAKTEGKDLLDGEDVKKAIWLFHVPDEMDDPCSKAAANILELDSKGLRNKLLLEDFRSLLPPRDPPWRRFINLDR